MSALRPSRSPKSRVEARPAVRQAENLRHTRREHAAETVGDYLEAIAQLSASLGEARVARLQRDGYVSTQPYRAIFHTEHERKLAQECSKRHETVVAFLRGIGSKSKRGDR